MSSDPKPLTMAPATPFERRLLEAAGTERPSPELALRMAHGLGVPPPSSSLIPLPAAKAALSGWVSGGIVAAALCGVVGIWALTRSAAPVAQPRQAALPAAPAVAAPIVAPTAESVGAAAHADAARASDRPLSGGTATTARESAQVASPVPEKGDLREEIRLIDAARSAIAARSPESALTLLRRYTTSYPGGTFTQEAFALRIEALEQSGQHQKAQASARDFLARHPNSPLADRLQRLASAR